MAHRTLEITLISAKGLKDVNLFSKMAVYAYVSVSCDPRSRQRTSADLNGGRNPGWNSTLRFTVPADGGAAGGHSLRILLRTVRALGDRDVGEVRVPLAELLHAEPGDGSRPIQFVTYQVRRMRSRSSKGVINFSYKFSQPAAAPAVAPAAYIPPPIVYPAAPAVAPAAYIPPPIVYPAAPAVAPAAYIPPPIVYPAASAPPYPYAAPPSSKADEAVMAYPVGASTVAYPAYGAPPPYPPTYGYGYAPAGYGYGAPPPPMVPPQRKNNFGLGLGAGLIGGALGGLLIGDVVSDCF